MSTTSTSTSAVVAVAEPMFTSQERLVLAGFLAGYTGLTREACAGPAAVRHLVPLAPHPPVRGPPR